MFCISHDFYFLYFLFFIFKDFYFFIHRDRERERGRDIGRGSCRLHAESLTWDSIQGLQDTPWAAGKGLHFYDKEVCNKELGTKNIDFSRSFDFETYKVS